MKKSDKQKYIKNFGEDSLVETKIEYFDTLALEQKLFAEESKRIFIQEFEKIFDDLFSILKIDSNLRENLYFQIKSYLLQYYHESLTAFINQTRILKVAGDKTTHYEFLKSLSKKEINRIREQIREIIIPYILSILNIFKSLYENANLSEALIENERLKVELQSLLKHNEDFRASKTLPKSSVSLTRKFEIIDYFMKHPKVRENSASNEIHDKHKLSSDQQSFKNSFRAWYKKTINQKKYPIILEYLNEFEKRKKTK